MLYFPNQDYLNYLKSIKGYKRVKTIKEWIENPDNAYYLKPDGRAYGYKFKDTLRLYSYNTLVCEFHVILLEWINHGFYSKTTQKHQYDFLNTLSDHYGLNYHPIYKDENIKSGKQFIEKIKVINFESKRYSDGFKVKTGGFFPMIYFWRI